MLWRARRWRRLLNLIDHLPQNSHFMQAVSLDEEHARMIVAASKGQESQAWAPPMATWSTEAAVLADLLDEVRGLRHITLAVNSKGKQSAPLPYARPRTVISKVRAEERAKAHRSLVARMLPHKRD